MKKYNNLQGLDLPWEKFGNSNILITGANGMIASGLVEALYELSDAKNLNIQIHALCRNYAKAKNRYGEYLNAENFHLIIQDVTDPLKAGEHFDFIVHAASSAHPGAFNKTPVDVMKANILGTMNMLEYAKNDPYTRFLYISSSEVYGENEAEREIFTEDMPGIINHMRFRACYPESKRASETLALCYEKQYGSDVVIVRPAFIYGRDILDDNTRADAYFLRQALNHDDIVMYSDGTQIRSYCFVKDCISGILFAMLKGENGEIYNIGNCECVVTLKEYAQKLADYGHVSLIVNYDSKPEGVVFLKTTKLILDTTKLENLGWRPMYSLEDGLKDIFNENEHCVTLKNP